GVSTDGCSVPAQGELPDRVVTAGGHEKRAAGDEDLRAGPGRQRLTVVLPGHGRLALAERAAGPAQGGARKRVRGRQHLLTQGVVEQRRRPLAVLDQVRAGE